MTEKPSSHGFVLCRSVASSCFERNLQLIKIGNFSSFRFVRCIFFRLLPPNSSKEMKCTRTIKQRTNNSTKIAKFAEFHWINKNVRWIKRMSALTHTHFERGKKFTIFTFNLIRFFWMALTMPIRSPVWKLHVNFWKINIQNYNAISWMRRMEKKNSINDNLVHTHRESMKMCNKQTTMCFGEKCAQFRKVVIWSVNKDRIDRNRNSVDRKQHGCRKQATIDSLIFWFYGWAQAENSISMQNAWLNAFWMPGK